MCLEIKEHRYLNYPINAVTAYDGRRRIAVARRKRPGWLVIGHCVSWINKGSKKNVFGISHLHLRSITQVRKLFADIGGIEQ